MGDDSPLLFDQCPTVISPEGTAISQVAAAMQFAGGRLGLAPAPKDASPDARMEADARALSLALYSEEMRNNIFYKMLLPRAAVKVIRWKCGCCCGGCLSAVIGGLWGWVAGLGSVKVGD